MIFITSSVYIFILFLIIFYDFLHPFFSAQSFYGLPFYALSFYALPFYALSFLLPVVLYTLSFSFTSLMSFCGL